MCLHTSVWGCNTQRKGLEGKGQTRIQSSEVGAGTVYRAPTTRHGPRHTTPDSGQGRARTLQEPWGGVVEKSLLSSEVLWYLVAFSFEVTLAPVHPG